MYSSRDINFVIKDILTYSKWGSGKWFGASEKLSQGLELRGIFLDETPNEWSVDKGKYFEVIAGLIRSHGESSIVRTFFPPPRPALHLPHRVQQMKSRRQIKDLTISMLMNISSEIQGKSKSHLPVHHQSPALYGLSKRVLWLVKADFDDKIVHNPGTIPSPLYTPFADLIVKFEGAYTTYLNANMASKTNSFLETTKVPRLKLAYIIHSIPEPMAEEDLRALLKALAKDVGTLFITGLSANYYGGFWKGFGSWVGALCTLKTKYQRHSGYRQRWQKAANQIHF